MKLVGGWFLTGQFEQMIDIGHGQPVVIVPGLQGRWEWKRDAVLALARSHRVIAYSLCDERASGFACDPGHGFENYFQQLGAVLDRARLDRAAIVGVSYGGLIAVEFAARCPARVSSLVLASALSLPWSPDARARFYMRAPRLLFPAFVAAAPFRMRREIKAALPGWREQAAFAWSSARRFLREPVSPSRMTRRLTWIQDHAFADHRAIQAPTLLMTGEPELDRVVPVAVTRRYLSQIAGARHVVLARTGHLGVLTQPDRFSEVITAFVTHGVTGAHTRHKDLDDLRHSA